MEQLHLRIHYLSSQNVFLNYIQLLFSWHPEKSSYVVSEQQRSTYVLQNMGTIDQDDIARHLKEP